MDILVVEDHRELAENIKTFLELEGMSVRIEGDGRHALELVSHNSFDCIVLDLNLPGMTGSQLCRAARAQGIETPIIILTARTSKESVVSGLDLGADDYLKKPFEMEELRARIAALVRRHSGRIAKKLIIGDVEINFNKRTVNKKGKAVALSPKEYLLLEFLATNRGKVKDRIEILAQVWGDELLFSQTVDVHVSYLRKKLGKNIISTAVGGYLIEDYSNS